MSHLQVLMCVQPLRALPSAFGAFEPRSLNARKLKDCSSPLGRAGAFEILKWALQPARRRPGTRNWPLVFAGALEFIAQVCPGDADGAK